MALAIIGRVGHDWSVPLDRVAFDRDGFVVLPGAVLASLCADLAGAIDVTETKKATPACQTSPAMSKAPAATANDNATAMAIRLTR